LLGRFFSRLFTHKGELGGVCGVLNKGD
jgi:hypothetical protein